MKCLHPITIVKGKEKFEYPCRKCIPCKKATALLWSQRLIWELSGRPACFLTLTMDPENEHEICKRDLQLFFKRLRKKESPQDLKYFACGEHGEKSGRPHYHAIIIGWEPKDHYLIRKKNDLLIWGSKTLDQLWTLGEITTGTVTKESIFYTTGYVIKDPNGFRLMSKNIGLNYMKKNKNQLFYMWRNRDYKMGSYLLDKLLEETGFTRCKQAYEDDEAYAYLEFLKSEYDDLKKGLDEEIAKKEDARKYREVFTRAKQEIYRREKI